MATPNPGGESGALGASIFQVAECFYTRFLPEAERLKPGISQPILDTPYHRWRKGLSREQILQFCQQRYQQ